MADIVYTYRGKVYLNITNRCPCRCTFCIRSNGDGLGSAHTLWHKSDPTAEEIAKAIEEFDFSDFPEVTFCGYGEPLCAFDNLVIAGRLLKSKYPDIKIRINTNGLGNLVNGRDIVPELEGLVDTISISLNTPNADEYHKLVRSRFGEQSFDAMIDFAEECTKYIPNVVMTTVDTTITHEEEKQCQEICDRTGAKYRIRPWED